ncbi:DUF167 family protein [Hirschia baltica]|uniref:UPF0235 protein Hbal_2912 n=1 Tax=Hirschia baltica (strain ATCC 49814 / DSM 5838 / IFAM 1418) TaxID=582402 RepID=C6XR51_HIRBI|nr:DUF167 family protein [Hirschia baltica]ACT60582.1 protein of unknown function DUF167 [Hirschia baltica ATCC 49814]
MSTFWKTRDDDLDIVARVTPNASKDAVEAPEQDAAGRTYLKLRVRAIPDKGKANKAVEKLLASHFNLPKSKVAVVKGSTDRLKTIRISDGADLSSQLAEKYGDRHGDKN